MGLILKYNEAADMDNKTRTKGKSYKEKDSKHAKSMLIEKLRDTCSRHEYILKELMCYDLEIDDFYKIFESSSNQKVKCFLANHNDTPNKIKLELIKMGSEYSSRLCAEMIENKAITKADLDNISLCALESHCSEVLLRYCYDYIYRRSVMVLESNESITECYSAIAILEELVDKYSDDKASKDLLKYKTIFKVNLQSMEENSYVYDGCFDHCEAECDYCEDCVCCMGMQGC